MKTKLCNLCRVEKDMSEFNKRTLKSGNLSLRPKCRPCEAQITKAYQKTPAGKEAYKRAEINYVNSGGRGKAEQQRKEKPISEARMTSIKIRKVIERELHKDIKVAKDEFSIFVLRESVRLRKLRESIVGGRWEIDHIHPLIKGGKTVWNNLQVVPRKWNRKKSTQLYGTYFCAQLELNNGC
jgi:5-methylcytosine-specific restriction endonuclease McrA